MIELLTHANHTDNVNCADGKKPRYGTQKYQARVRELRDLYEAILVAGEAQNPIAPATGKRGRAKQSKAKPRTCWGGYAITATTCGAS